MSFHSVPRNLYDHLNRGIRESDSRQVGSPRLNLVHNRRKLALHQMPFVPAGAFHLAGDVVGATAAVHLLRQRDVVGVAQLASCRGQKRRGALGRSTRLITWKPPVRRSSSTNTVADVQYRPPDGFKPGSVGLIDRGRCSDQTCRGWLQARATCRSSDDPDLTTPFILNVLAVVKCGRAELAEQMAAAVKKAKVARLLLFSLPLNSIDSP